MENPVAASARPAADMTAGEARAAVSALKDALARAERRHRECWDETERLCDLCVQLCDLKREDRARLIAGCEPISRADHLKGDLTQADLQAAFFDLYSAELEMDKARAELLSLLGNLPESLVQEIGEQAPAQKDFDDLPNAWGIAAIENHLRRRGAADEPDPVDQLNYRRWLVELSQGALDYSSYLEHEMSRHRAELDALERAAKTDDFFEGDELEQIAQAAALQQARIVACREQLDKLASSAGALGKRMEACERELQRFLGGEG